MTSACIIELECGNRLAPVRQAGHQRLAGLGADQVLVALRADGRRSPRVMGKTQDGQVRMPFL